MLAVEAGFGVATPRTTGDFWSIKARRDRARRDLKVLVARVRS